MMKSPLLQGGSWIAMAALASFFAGCSSESNHNKSAGSSGYRDSSSQEAHEAVVEITSAHQFSPRDISIRAGESILWKNSSSETHTVTADPAKVASKENVVLPPGVKPFSSGELRPGKTWRQTFNTPGTYKYVCMMHERDAMTGTITVRPMEPQTR
jgi:plastocyanin